MRQSKLVADTNVLMSAFISDSTTRDLLRDLDVALYAPETFRVEVEKYDALIREKSGLSEPELHELKTRLFGYIEIVPSEEIESNRDEALYYRTEGIGTSSPQRSDSIVSVVSVQ